MDEQTILLLALAGCLLLLIALIIAALLIRRTITATIEGFYWFRKILFEHYIWVKDSSYWGFPSGSRNQYKKTESHQVYEVIRHDTITTQQNGVTTTTTATSPTR